MCQLRSATMNTMFVSIFMQVSLGRLLFRDGRYKNSHVLNDYAKGTLPSARSQKGCPRADS